MKGNELLTNSGANLKQLCLERTAAHAANIRLKEIKKRRALFGNQTVVLLTNIIGKRTVVLLIPSFFYFFNPFFVIRHAMAAQRLQTDEQETTFLQGRPSRVCHSSQNKKRSNPYTQANASVASHFILPQRTPCFVGKFTFALIITNY